MSFLRTSNSIYQQARNAFRLKGVYPSVVTPFIEQETGKKVPAQIDYVHLERILDHVKRYPIAGIALLGYSSEAQSLSFKQKLELVSHVRCYLGFSRTLLVGAGLESTADTIDLVNRMGEAGANACFVYNPVFFREHLDRKAYLEHFRSVADHASIPTILYHRPVSRPETEIPIDVITNLAKHHNIMGMLDTSGDMGRIATICKRTYLLSPRNSFDVMTNSGGHFLPAIVAGCRGTVCALGNILPGDLIRLQQLVSDGKFEEAQKLQWRLVEPNKVVTSQYGVAGLKTVLSKFLDLGTGAVQPPLRELSDQERVSCIDAFNQNGFLLAEDESVEEQKSEK